MLLCAEDGVKGVRAVERGIKQGLLFQGMFDPLLSNTTNNQRAQVNPKSQ